MIFGAGEETLEGVTSRLLAEKNITVGVVDAFTAGRIGQRLLTSGSQKFKGSLSLSQKGGWPGQSQVLAKEAQAVFLAKKIRDLLHCDLALGVCLEETDSERTLYLALTGKIKETYSHRIGGFFETLPDRAAVMALDFLRKELINL